MRVARVALSSALFLTPVGLGANAQADSSSLPADALVAFSVTHHGDADLHVMRLDGSGYRNVTRTPNHWEWGPSWSPDGTELAYSHGDIHIYDLCFRSRRTLREARGDYYFEDPSWSADGRLIAYEFVESDGGGIAVTDIRGRGRESVLTPGENALPGEPSWSPDGRFIAYRSDWDEMDIFVSERGSTQERDVSKNGVPDWSPDWSSDGRSIAYVSEGSVYGGWLGDSIKVTDPEGTISLTIVTNFGPIGEVSWTPDDEWLVFDSRKAGNWNLYAVSRDGTQLHQLTYSPLHERSPDVVSGTEVDCG